MTGQTRCSAAVAKSQEPIALAGDLMSTITAAPSTQFDTATIMGALYGDGIIGLKGAFDREWARDLGEDIAVLFEEALKLPGGAVGRGPKRYYVEIHPEGIRGF